MSHKCNGVLPKNTKVITCECYEDDKGKLWLFDGCSSLQVNFCPICGYTAKTKIIQPTEVDKYIKGMYNIEIPKNIKVYHIKNMPKQFANFANLIGVKETDHYFIFVTPNETEFLNVIELLKKIDDYPLAFDYEEGGKKNVIVFIQYLR